MFKDPSLSRVTCSASSRIFGLAISLRRSKALCFWSLVTRQSRRRALALTRLRSYYSGEGGIADEPTALLSGDKLTGTVMFFLSQDLLKVYDTPRLVILEEMDSKGEALLPSKGQQPLAVVIRNSSPVHPWHLVILTLTPPLFFSCEH